MFLYHLHARHIGFSISEIYHSGERDRSLFVGDILVHSSVVAHLFDTLVDFEEELRLGSIVYGYGWPIGDSLLIVEKGAGVDVLKFLGDRCALYHLLQSRGVDVVLYVQSDTVAIFIHERKPLFYAAEQFYILAEFLKRFPGERDIILLGFVEHQIHIGQNAVGILTLCKLSVFLPELVFCLACSLYESKLLHIARRQCAVEIINQRYLWSLLCHIPFSFLLYLP